MDHQQALREMSVEKYLLGELNGAERDLFEEHLFDCADCAADLRTAVTFAEAARVDLAADFEAAELRQTARPREKARSWADWLRPQWLAPAFAACLLLLMGQTFLRVPNLQRQLAQAESPRVLNNLALTGGATRGTELPRVTAPENGSFLISVDLPPTGMSTSYLCSLYAPSGALVWKGSALPQAGDMLQIVVPVAATQPGQNTLIVQGSHPESASGATLDDPIKHPFLLELHK